MNFKKTTSLALKLLIVSTEANIHPKEPYREVYSRECLRAYSTHKNKLTWKELLKRAIMIYLCTKQAVMITLQYAYDYLMIQHKRQEFVLRTKFNHLREPGKSHQAAWLLLTSHNSSNSSLLRDTYDGLHDERKRTILQLAELDKLISIYKNALKSLGAPFIEMSLIIQCIQSFVILGFAALIFASLIYFRSMGPWNIRLYRLILDRPRELINLDKLIESECTKAIHSSNCYTFRSLQRVPMGRAVSFFKPNSRAQGRDKAELHTQRKCVIDPVSTIRMSQRNHQMVIQLMAKLKRDRALSLANQDENWLNTVCIIYTVAAAVIMVGSVTAFALLIALGLIIYAPTTWTVMDAWGLVEVEMTFAMAAFMLSFGTAPMMCVFIDQTYVVMKLAQDIEQTIRTNEISCEEINGLLLFRLEKGDAFHHSFNELDLENKYLTRMARKINENLMRIIMLHRILKRQFVPLRYYYRFATTVITSLYIVYPFFVVLHTIYSNRLSSILLVSTVWLYLFLYDCAYLPICTYHAQINRLFKRLFDLMSHVDRIQANRTNLYNQNIANLLRQEIKNPEIGLERLSIEIFFSHSINYKHLLKFHFWVGLLSIYGLLASHSRSEEYLLGIEKGSQRLMGIIG